MRKFVFGALVALASTAFANQEPDLSNAKIICVGEKDSFTLSVRNKLDSSKLHLNQYLAFLSQTKYPKERYVILNQSLIQTRCEVGWSINFVSESSEFSYTVIEFNPCGQTGVHAVLTTSEGAASLNCKIEN